MAVRAEALGEIEPVARQPHSEAAHNPVEKVVTINGLPLELAQSDILSEVEILGIREGGYVECFVPFEMIDNEEVPVKEEWAASLAQQMGDIAEKEGGTGQHMPVTLGFISGEPTLKIMDSFHRSAGLRQRGEDRVYATVKLTDWDSLYDFRIFTAKDHTHVRFSRVVQWIGEVWEKSPLSEIEIGEDKKLTVAQAIIMYTFGTEGTRFNMQPEEVESVKEWVARKEHLWGLDAMTIRDFLKIAETVDPQLVHSTREKSRKDILEAPTQSIIRIFSKELPDNFELQNLVMDTAKVVRMESGQGPRSLTGPEIRTLCLIVKECESVSEAKAVIANIDWKTFEPEYGETKQRALRRAHDPRHKGAVVLSQTVREISTVRERIALSMLRGEDVTESQKKLVEEARQKATELIQDLGSLVVELSGLLGEDAPKIDIPKVVSKPVKPQLQRTPIFTAQRTANVRTSEVSERRRQEEIVAHEGFMDLIHTDQEERFKPATVHEFVNRYLLGEIEFDQMPYFSTRSELRQLKVAMAQAVEIKEEDRPDDWAERFRELQIMENPALADVLK